MVSNFALVVAIYLVLCTIVAAARECGTCKKMAKIVRGDTIARWACGAECCEMCGGFRCHSLAGYGRFLTTFHTPVYYTTKLQAP